MANTNPTPKQRLQSNKSHITLHRQMIEMPQFEYGCDMALMEYQRFLSQQPATFNDAAASHFKMVGAQEFIQTLRNLAEMPSRTTSVDKDNLIHQN